MENYKTGLSIFFQYTSIVFKETSIKEIGAIFSVALFILMAIVGIGSEFNIPMDHLTGDPTAVAGIHPLTGVLSNLGIVLWCAAATACGLGARLVFRKLEKEIFLFLFCSFLLTSFLMLDDLFQFHEDLSSTIGLNQKVVYLVLGASVAAYLVRFRNVLLQTQIFPLLLAFNFLVISIIADTIVYKLFGDEMGQLLYFIEDGAKWIGIVFWCYYFVITSYQLICAINESAIDI